MIPPSEEEVSVVYTTQKTAAGQITFSHLSSEDQNAFIKARAKEANDLVNAGAVRILSIHESQKFEQDHPECVLDSRWMEKWKVTEDEKAVAKSRWCVVGWQDPDIHDIERYSPMPNDVAINVVA